MTEQVEQKIAGVGSEYANLNLRRENIRLYTLPANYNPNDFPPVRMREKRIQNLHDQSETQRKRRSKNRLSQRRSTGPIALEDIEQAMSMGPYNIPAAVS